MNEIDLLDKIVFYYDTKIIKSDSLENFNIEIFDIKNITNFVKNSEICKFHSEDIIKIFELLDRHKENLLIKKLDEIIIEKNGFDILKIIQNNNNCKKGLRIEINSYRKFLNKDLT